MSKEVNNNIWSLCHTTYKNKLPTYQILTMKKKTLKNS